MELIDKEYWANAYKRILGVRKETFYKSFDTEKVNVTVEDQIKELLKKYPNDAEAGHYIRNLYRDNQKG